MKCGQRAVSPVSEANSKLEHRCCLVKLPLIHADDCMANHGACPKVEGARFFAGCGRQRVAVGCVSILAVVREAGRRDAIRPGRRPALARPHRRPVDLRPHRYPRRAAVRRRSRRPRWPGLGTQRCARQHRSRAARTSRTRSWSPCPDPSPGTVAAQSIMAGVTCGRRFPGRPGAPRSARRRRRPADASSRARTIPLPPITSSPG